MCKILFGTRENIQDKFSRVFSARLNLSLEKTRGEKRREEGRRRKKKRKEKCLGEERRNEGGGEARSRDEDRVKDEVTSIILR